MNDLKNEPVTWEETPPDDKIMRGIVTISGFNRRRTFDLNEQFNLQVGIVQSLDDIYPPVTPGMLFHYVKKHFCYSHEIVLKLKKKKHLASLLV